jgi:glutathione S-transferase
MKFYNSIGPNPRLVRMFMAEKGIDMKFEEIDLMAGDNRRPPYTDKNPAGEMPALELDDGRVVAETVAICEYLEEQQPDPPLIGDDAESRAQTRMWVRRIEHKVTEPLTHGFRNAEGQALFKERRHLIPQAADDQKAIAQEGLAWIDAQMQGRDYVAGERLSLADILLFSMLDFGAQVGQSADPELANIKAWYERVGARPSAEASQ